MKEIIGMQIIELDATEMKQVCYNTYLKQPIHFRLLLMSNTCSISKIARPSLALYYLCKQSYS